MLGTVVTKQVDSQLYDWIRQVSFDVDNTSGGTTVSTQVRYVNKAGSDVTGNGSLSAPYLTVQAAETSITDAASNKIYYIEVGAGDFAELFTMKPWVFIVGQGRKVTRLSPVQAQWLGAGFVNAGSQEAGILNCSIGTALAIDFAAIVSPGAGIFHLYNCDIESTIAATGNNVANLFLAQAVFQIAASGVTHTFTNLGGSLDSFFMKFDSLTFSNTAAYSCSWNNGGVGFTGALTLSCASAVNTLTLRFLSGTTGANATATIVLTGDGVRLRGLGMIRSTGLPDTDITFDFVTGTAGATKLVDGGTNLIAAGANTATRTYTVNTPTVTGTRLKIKNQTAQIILLTFVAASTGGMTYILAFGELDAYYDGTWEIQNSPQQGTVALTNGVSAAILADITATSVIVATLKTFSGATGIIQAKDTDRVVGTRAAGTGSFKLTSVTQAAGATVATDQGTYDWVVLRP
jgi:hypothetical protein